MKSHFKQCAWLVLFSIAMGFLEAAVVIYLRALYYKDGFQFPLTEMEPTLAVTEVVREAATIIMLSGVAVMAGQSTYQRFAFFLTAFGVWDIFYYVFLKIILDWPASILTWDILFLLPVPWVGPVLTPCVVSLTMILLAAVMYDIDRRNLSGRINMLEWLLILSGSSVVLLSWTWDYFSFDQGYPMISIEKSLQFFSTYIPQNYHWWVFGLGEGLMLSGVFIFFYRTHRRDKKTHRKSKVVSFLSGKQNTPQNPI